MVFKIYNNYIFFFKNLIFVLDFEFIKPPATGILVQAGCLANNVMYAQRPNLENLSHNSNMVGSR